jgi:hypothetical protein
MTLCHTFTDNAYAELTGPDIKFWEGQGLATYEGGLDGFQECYPDRMAALIAAGCVKRIPDDDPAPQ